MSETEAKTFASRKFDLVNAIVADTRLTMSDRTVAIYLTRHADKAWRLHPSQELIARAVGLKPRAVKYCIGHLVETGWLNRERRNRRLANDYTFSHANVAMVAARVEIIRDELAALRGNIVPLIARPEVHEIAPVMGTEMPLVMGTEMPPNTLGSITEVEHLSSACAEQEALEQGSWTTNDKPAREVSPSHESERAGGSKPQIVVSESLRNSRIVRTDVDPRTSLDRQFGRAKR